MAPALAEVVAITTTRSSATVGGRRRPQLGAGRQLAAGTHERLPHRPLDPLEQQHLGRPPAGLAQVEAGGQHPGGVEHQQVARLEQVGQVSDHPVVGLDARATVDEQPGCVALGGGRWAMRSSGSS